MFPLNSSEAASKIIVAVIEIEKATKNQKMDIFDSDVSE
jgi:hypothetical protein